MSLHDLSSTTCRGLSGISGAVALALVAALSLTSACTVRPLYANGGTTAGIPGVSETLSSISIKPVSNRYGQEVRNHLIFAFGRGAGQPADPRYTLDLRVIANNESAVLVQNGDDNEPTAGTMTLIGIYTVSDNGKGQVIASGTRRATASYDLPKQEFASIRAVRDAENRAARELAQVLQLAIAQDVSKGS